MNIAKADARLNEKNNLRFLQIANSDKPIALYSKVILKVKASPILQYG